MVNVYLFVLISFLRVSLYVSEHAHNIQSMLMYLLMNTFCHFLQAASSPIFYISYVTAQTVYFHLVLLIFHHLLPSLHCHVYCFIEQQKLPEILTSYSYLNVEWVFRGLSWDNTHPRMMNHGYTLTIFYWNRVDAKNGWLSGWHSSQTGSVIHIVHRTLFILICNICSKAN